VVVQMTKIIDDIEARSARELLDLLSPRNDFWGAKSEVDVISPLCASSMGFTLHAATTVSSHDGRAREALARYIMRPRLVPELNLAESPLILAIS
jgi:hypothetical protein